MHVMCTCTYVMIGGTVCSGHVHTHLTYAHSWVRLVCAQLFGLAFSRWSVTALVDAARWAAEEAKVATESRTSGKKSKRKRRMKSLLWQKAKRAATSAAGESSSAWCDDGANKPQMCFDYLTDQFEYKVLQVVMPSEYTPGALT